MQDSRCLAYSHLAHTEITIESHFDLPLLKRESPIQPFPFRKSGEQKLFLNGWRLCFAHHSAVLVICFAVYVAKKQM